MILVKRVGNFLFSATFSNSKHMTRQQQRIIGGHLAHRSRGVTISSKTHKEKNQTRTDNIVRRGRGSWCNTPDMISPICTPTLAVSGVNLFYFLGFGFLSPCVVIVVMHLISCHHVHCICIRVHLLHSSFSPLSVLHSGASFSSGGQFYLSFVCGD